MKSLIVLSAFFFTLQIAAQQFEGEITFSINYIEVPAELQGMESMLPTAMNYFFSGDNMAIKQNTAFGTQTIVMNNAANTGYVLMDMMGQKIALKVDDSQTEEETSGPEFTKTSETKEIAGYNCTKYLVKTDEIGDTEVWTTNELKANMGSKNPMKNVEGFPLEYVSEKEGMTMRLTATNVTKKELDNSMFDIPTDFTVMTEEELKAMFGQ